MRYTLLIGSIILIQSLTAAAYEPNGSPVTAGVLDEPFVAPGNSGNRPSFSVGNRPGNRPNNRPIRNPNLDSTNPAVRAQALRVEAKKEIKALEKLSVAALKSRAKKGERAAQVVLGNEFAREAQSLVGLPLAANQAAEDAVRWYSLAAQRGYPGAPSLDQAGIQFYPIRVQRTTN